jgi:hypothetical protein
MIGGREVKLVAIPIWRLIFGAAGLILVFSIIG